MTNKKYLSLVIVIFLAALEISHAVEYTLTNNAADTPGGIRFTNEIGDDYTIQTLESATNFIWNVFQESSEEERKSIETLNVIIESFDGVAFTVNNEIHVSTNYIEGYSSGDLKTEITGVLYHEMTHVWQWNGNGQANGGLIEGIADFVRLKAGFASSTWVLPGQGDRWDQGYSVTARFLDYCTSLDEDFVAKINNEMRDGYSDELFVEILGKSVDQLWTDYKTMF